MFSLQSPYSRATLLVPLFSGLVLVACSRNTAVEQEDIRPVRTLVVGPSEVDTASTWAAEIKPRVESRLGFRVGGKIVERLVDVGAVVRPGQMLARLDAGDLALASAAAQAQLASARASFELADTNLKRTKALASQNFISGAQVDSAETQLRAAKGQMDAAQAQAQVQGNQSAYAVLLADRAGVVTGIEAEVGQVVAAGTPVVRVAVGTDKDVVFSLPEQGARALKPGLPLVVSLWSQPGQLLNATVRDVSPAADPVTRTYAVKATLDDPQGQAALGLTATVRLATGTVAQAIVLPLAAIVDVAGKPGVWIVEKDMAKRVPVVLAAPTATGIAIASGLQAGQSVITAGVHTIKEGQKVKSTAAAPVSAIAATSK
jgi:RND family efflux transporter MFP subunit